MNGYIMSMLAGMKDSPLRNLYGFETSVADPRLSSSLAHLRHYKQPHLLLLMSQPGIAKFHRKFSRLSDQSFKSSFQRVLRLNSSSPKLQ